MSKNNNNDSGMGCMIVMLLAVFAMPVVAMYLIFAGKSSEQKILGIALLVVSVIVYTKFEMA